MPRTRAPPRRTPCTCRDCMEGPERLLQSSSDVPPRALLIYLDSLPLGGDHHGAHAGSLCSYPLPYLDDIAREGVCGRIAFVKDDASSKLEQIVSLTTAWESTFDPHFRLLILGDDGMAFDSQKLAKEVVNSDFLRKDRSLSSQEDKRFPYIQYSTVSPATMMPAEVASLVLSSFHHDAFDIIALCLGKQSLVSWRWIDELLAALDSYSWFSCHVLLSLIFDNILQPNPLAYSSTEEPPWRTETKTCQAHEELEAGKGGVILEKPKQSYQFRGCTELSTNKTSIEAISICRLDGVTRRDEVQSFCIEEMVCKGAGGVILAERVLWELAYKVGRAPKYGA